MTPNQTGDEDTFETETTEQFIKRKKGGASFERVVDPNNEILGATLNYAPFVSSILNAIQSYFESAFFFDPQRQSKQILTMLETPRLSSGGDNLAQVLATLNLNDKNAFKKVEVDPIV